MLRYRIVDVFTDEPLAGNALAVIPDAGGLDAATMQKIAREFNLSETAFVMSSQRPDCAARVRIFTPYNEMEFAGHPTIGTAWVLLDEGAVPARDGEFLLEENVGAVPVFVGDGPDPLIWLRTPDVTAGPVFDRRLCAGALGLNEDELLDIPPQLLSAGNPTIYIGLKTREAVDKAWIDSAGVAAISEAGSQSGCVFVFCQVPGGVYSRMFAPDYGIIEDPATGSSTGPLAVFMMSNGLIGGEDGSGFISEQGVKMQRRSILHVRLHGDKGKDGIDVGGAVVPLAEGEFRF